MIELSDEQAIIISDIKDNNVIVEAVAGSGKTTLILHIAMTYPDKKILQLTYNTVLKNEVREKVRQLSNIEVHSYHSLAVKHYNKKAFNDIEFTKSLRMKPVCHKKYDIIAIDEMQDASINHVMLVCKFMRDMGIYDSCILLILGDTRQCIYQYNGADSRYLTHAEHIFQKIFIRRTLSTSYRLNYNVSRFINEVMIGYPLITSYDNGDNSIANIKYIKGNIFSAVREIAHYLHSEINNKSIQPGDVFILIPSIRHAQNKRTPFKVLENLLCKLGIPCNVIESNNCNKNTSANKITFATYHGSKGCERDIVIIMNFDMSYFEYYAKDTNKHICPNPLYVAVTRAKKILFLLRGDKEELPFLKTNISEMTYVDYKLLDKNIRPVNAQYTNNISVTDMIRNTSDILDISPNVHRISLSDTFSSIPINSNDEEISNITGIAIPSMFELKDTGRSGVLTCVLGHKTHSIYKKLLHDVDFDNPTIYDFLKISTVYDAINTGMHHKLYQIKSFDWLTSDMVDKCFSNMKNNLEKGGEYETKYTCDVTVNMGLINIVGVFDYLTDTHIYEFKCTNNLTDNHKLQLIFYMYIYKKITGNELTGVLLNIFNNERYDIVYDKNIDMVVEDIIHKKFKNHRHIPDDDFIKLFHTKMRHTIP